MLANNSHEISCLICYFWLFVTFEKAAKFETDVCGPLWDNISYQRGWMENSVDTVQLASAGHEQQIYFQVQRVKV